MIQLGTKFFEIAGKQSYDVISKKMKVAKEKAKTEEQQNAYEDIISELMRDNRELENIAGEYKRHYDNLTISDEDIEHLQNTLNSVTDILINFLPPKEDAKREEQEQTARMVVELLNKDTLKTVQLLGFNYKEAIGEPLTEITADLIKKKLSTNKQGNGNRGNKKK